MHEAQVAGLERPDYAELEEALRALSYSARLELLQLLRVPHTLPEIHLSPGPSRAGTNPDRPISRQALQEHLDKLVEAGLVVAQEPEGKAGRLRAYVVNPRQLYRVTEEFRKLSTVTVGAPGGRDATMGLPEERPARHEPGPKLVLVHGLLEGKAYALRRTDLKEPGRGWVIGRKAGVHVSLGYDPYISLENSEVVPESNGYVLLDLRTSKNGTWLNWRRLGREERAPLEPGDVIGVGRSSLVFRVK